MAANSELFDQYYTKKDVSKKCCEILKEQFPDISSHTFLEPSAGTGSFVDAIHSVFGDVKIKAYDIEPQRSDIKKADFTKIKLAGRKLITIGNPPFGKRSSLAIEFFNIAAEKSDVIAFIVPVQFEKYSVQKELNPSFKLVYSQRLGKDSFLYNEKVCDIHCTFQIWTRQKTDKTDLRILNKPLTKHPDFELFLYNNTASALKYFNKELYQWEFAVPRQGFYDYSLRITDEKALNKKVQYMFFKSNRRDVLDKLMSIDYEKLSHNNTTIPGYGKADVVRAYSERGDVGE